MSMRKIVAGFICAVLIVQNMLVAYAAERTVKPTDATQEVNEVRVETQKREAGEETQAEEKVTLEYCGDEPGEIFTNAYEKQPGEEAYLNVEPGGGMPVI